ncbi:unnamed protein product [Clonostachys solani]|uniref:F-box domain-containing protein n=1 Tax=Clonostachys solani TaxID=160281 RepID=A0A9N9Z9H8_9HYPO|nr:unnamed protein product [Clonostachys solani]
MDEDISKLMDGRYEANLPDGRDEYGKSDEYAKLGRCLLLENVTGGRPRADQSRFLSLPADILASIVDILSANAKSDLGSLALVNSDCQQLARSGQFSDVHFDYSYGAQHLALHLRRDADRQINNKAINSVSIGSCVRRVTFASNPDHVAEYHPEVFGLAWGDQGSRSAEEKDQLKREAYEYYRNVQESTLIALSTMPNLEVLKWSDDIAIDEEFFKHISRSSAQHIILDCLSLKMPITLRHPIVPAVWPLRKLDLDVRLPRQVEDGKPADSGFYEDLLRLCAPSLESLKFNERGSEVSKMVFFKEQDPPSFPRLRNLRLRVLDPPTSFISLFTDSPVKSLEMPKEIRNTSSMAALAADRFPDLESLVVPHLPFSNTLSGEIACFLQEQKKIQKLCVHENSYAKGNRAHLDRHIIPVLAQGGFEYLTSLSLQWGGAGIDQTATGVVHVAETSLAVLGQITSLQKLKLAAGVTSGWQCQWLVDHESLAKLLRPLQNLQLLAFYRDTYSTLGDSDPDVEDYYMRRTLTETGRSIASDRPELDVGSDQGTGPAGMIWERAHRNRMLKYAEGYASVLQTLETIVCGQLPIAIKCDPQESKGIRKAVPLTKDRDVCYTYLQTTFGLGTWLEVVETP